MYANQINISQLVPKVATQLSYDAWLMIHLASEGEFSTSELQAINCCRKSKVILFTINIGNHQGNHLQQSATYKSTNFNLIHKFNCPSKNHTTTVEWRTCRKSMLTLYDESKNKLRKLLRQCILDDNKWITYWQWFLSCDLHTLYYIENEAWYKYKRPLSRAHGHIELQTYTKPKFQLPSRLQVYRISLTISNPHIYG